MSSDSVLEAKKNGTHTVAPVRSLPAPRNFELPRSPEATPASAPAGHDFSRVPVNAPQVAGSCPMSLASPKACPFGGACHTCPARVQAKLAISQPGDIYEQEADRIAETITRTEEPLVVQRKCTRCGDEDEAELQRKGTSSQEADPEFKAGTMAKVHDVLQSTGQPLDPGTRNFMEPRFGQDFSSVRVHTDLGAAESARSINARAYTVGQHVVFGTGQYVTKSKTGQELLAHELTHVIQQARQPVTLQTHLEVSSPVDDSERQADAAAERVIRGLPPAVISPAPPTMIQREGEEEEGFEPWPGQTGTDVSGTRQQQGTVLSERVQRTGDPNYAAPQPILLEFDTAHCTLTSTMEINFVPSSNPNTVLDTEDFGSLKERMISVANERLNGWINIRVGNEQACTACRDGTITVNVVAREGTSSGADVVELRSGTGRANAGSIPEGGENWLTALFGGISDLTLWHEAGHIVLGIADEYPPESGDPSRPAQRINTSDWSIESSHSEYGRRSVMHPRHFSFMSAWLGRRFPGCTFELAAIERPIVVDVVTGLSIGASDIAGGWGLYESLDIAAGFPLDTQRRMRVLLGGYASLLSDFSSNARMAFAFGALVGLDYSTNRSGGGFGIGWDLRAGGAVFGSGLPESELGTVIPTLGGSLHLGYEGPVFEAGATAETGTFLSGSLQGNPYYLLGLRAGLSF